MTEFKEFKASVEDFDGNGKNTKRELIENLEDKFESREQIAKGILLHSNENAESIKALVRNYGEEVLDEKVTSLTKKLDNFWNENLEEFKISNHKTRVNYDGHERN